MSILEAGGGGAELAGTARVDNRGSGAGEHVCRLCSPVQWLPYILSDAPEPSRVHISPSPAEEGRSVELMCVSPASPRATNYTWYHNRNKVPGATQEKLQITNVSLWHAGNYSCLAENHLGRGTIYQEADLDVQCEQPTDFWLLEERGK